MTYGQIFFYVVGGLVFLAHGAHLVKIVQHWRKTRFLKSESMGFCARELLEFSRAYYRYAPGLEERVEAMKDTFLRESLRSYLTGAVRGHEWLHALRAKADGYRLSLYSRLQDISKLVTLLPALGWIMGLSALGGYIFDGPSTWTTDRLVTVYGTLLGAIVYGLCLFHFVVHPMAIRIEQHARETYEKNVFLLMIVAMLVRKKSTLELFESVNLLLPEGHKLEWTELSPDGSETVPAPAQKTA